MLSAAQDRVRQLRCFVAVLTWHRVEDDADLHPNTTRAPAGFKFVNTDGFGTMGMDEISDRR
jgi:hypothetical protein